VKVTKPFLLYLKFWWPLDFTCASGHSWVKPTLIKPVYMRDREALYSVHFHIAIISLIFQQNAHVQLNICIAY